MKLTYINEQQIVGDAAQMLLEAHLRWSGSVEGIPSKDLDGVRGRVMDAYFEAKFSIRDYENMGEWEALSNEEQASERAKAELLFVKAAHLADRKWEAAMTLLGIEQ